MFIYLAKDGNPLDLDHSYPAYSDTDPTGTESQNYFIFIIFVKYYLLFVVITYMSLRMFTEG